MATVTEILLWPMKNRQNKRMTYLPLFKNRNPEMTTLERGHNILSNNINFKYIIEIAMEIGWNPRQLEGHGNRHNECLLIGTASNINRRAFRIEYTILVQLTLRLEPSTTRRIKKRRTKTKIKSKSIGNTRRQFSAITANDGHTHYNV